MNTNIDVDRLIQSIGMKFYLKYHKYILTNNTDTESLKILVSKMENYTNKSICSRISKMKRLIDNNSHDIVMDKIQKSKIYVGTQLHD